jgi:hypothetical protein
METGFLGWADLWYFIKIGIKNLKFRASVSDKMNKFGRYFPAGFYLGWEKGEALWRQAPI